MKNKILLLAALTGVGIALMSCGGEDSGNGGMSDDAWSTYWNASASDSKFDHFEATLLTSSDYFASDELTTEILAAGTTYIFDRDADKIDATIAGYSVTMYSAGSGTLASYEAGVQLVYSAYGGYAKPSEMSYDADNDRYTYDNGGNKYTYTFVDGEIAQANFSATGVESTVVYTWNTTTRLS